MKHKIEISKELEDLIPLFKQETQKNLELLKQAIQNKDFEGIRFISHKIKGSCGSYGFDYMSKLAKQIEDNSKNERSIETINKIFDELYNYYLNTEIIFVDKPL
ncbi:MAG: Hpt domain-containing protein [Leptospiraceae bacterium]|jgi:HPt (histidine-containing phosphotransfer) domain-containing protein|nr:Hpt domain-containing protein [Leptospiraceae bacterium]